MLGVVYLSAIALGLAFLWWLTIPWRTLRGIPGPFPLPIVGNIPEFLRSEQLALYTSLRHRFGGVVGLFLGTRPTILLNDPKLIHEVTVTAAEQFRNRPPLEVSTQKTLGLIQARDDYWKRLRRTIAPTFNVIHIKNMLPLIHEEIKIMISQLETACDDQKEVDIHAMFTRLTLDIIGRIAFGTKLNAQRDKNSEFLQSIGWIFQNVPRANGLFSILFPGLWKIWQNFFPSELRTNVLNAEEALDKLSIKLIRQRKRERQEEEEESSLNKSDKATERVPNDFLDLLLDARDKVTGERLTEMEIQSQVNIFLLAGHETTANTLAYTIYLVSQHSEVDEKLYEELSNIFTDDDDDDAILDLNQINAMNHLTMAISESLRIYPPATSAFRQANEDTVIGNQYFVPKNTSIIIPIKSLGCNPDYWPEPEKFLPFERWAGQEAAKHALVWLPFGAGPRNCIGQRFALIEAKMVLAHVLRRFRFKLSPGQIPLQLQPGITTSPKYGIKVKVERR
jgi:thromboxane-A synthase